MEDKSNEITAIPQLLRVLEISGCIITIDALVCQKGIAAAIMDQEADYLLALKENPGRLYEDVAQLFDDLQASADRAYTNSQARTVDQNHGRLETRTCVVIADPPVLMHLCDGPEWKGLQAVVKVPARCQAGEQVSEKDHYFLSNLSTHA